MRARMIINEIRRGGLPLGKMGVGAERIYLGYFAMLRLYPEMEGHAVPLAGFEGELRHAGDGWRSGLSGDGPHRVRLDAEAESRMERVTGIPIEEMMCVDVVGLPDAEFPYHRVGSTDTMSRVGLLMDWLRDGEEGPQLHELDERPVAVPDHGEELTWHIVWFDWARIGYLSLGDDEWAFLVYDRPPVR